MRTLTTPCRTLTPPAMSAAILLGVALLLGLSLLLGRKVLPASPARTAFGNEIPIAAVSSMFDDMQSTWTRLFSSMGTRYIEPGMVVFRDMVKSACGDSEPATGSFYCPSDQKVYVDLGVYQALREHFGELGDLGQAHMHAHEIGHHVQTLLGIEQRVRLLESNEGRAVDQSMRLELQADCLSGVWWHFAARRHTLEGGDIERALNAAAAIGAGPRDGVSAGHDSAGALTHGSSAQRVVSFRRGFGSGQVSACDPVP